MNNSPRILFIKLLIHSYLQQSTGQDLGYEPTTIVPSHEIGRSYKELSAQQNSINDFDGWQTSGKLLADSSDGIYHKYGDYDSLGHEDFYHQHRPWDHTSVKPFVPMHSTKTFDLFSSDFLKVALIALLKILFFKLQAVGFLKLGLMLLLKVPLFLLGGLFKVIFLAKILNLFKILTIPLFLPFLFAMLGPLLPFLLIPLAPALLIPFLLPLLLFLPIPVLTLTTTTTTTTAATTGRRRRRRELVSEDNLRSPDMIESFRYIIESEKCLERIACRLASDKKSAPFSLYINWIFDTLKRYLSDPRFTSYMESYKIGSTLNKNPDVCNNFYPCSSYKM